MTRPYGADRAQPSASPCGGPATSFFVRLRDVVFGYFEGNTWQPVLRGIDGQIAAGQLIALLGQSGSGKSTLLHLVAGLEKPRSGTIEAGGVCISALGERDRTLFRRRHIGFVYQAFNLLPTLTALENVALAAELNGLGAAAARTKSQSLLAELGLGTMIHRYPDRLSGGEQQRVAIARALVHDPWLLLADEPTGNLDRATGGQILDLLDTTLRQRGHAMLVATHSREVADRADRVWTLVDGLLHEA